LLYKVSYVVGILGYIIMMATFMGFYLFFGVKPHVWMDLGLLMMFYALYYGVLARDVAEICTEKMVSGIGVRKICYNDACAYNSDKIDSYYSNATVSQNINICF
jgi:hypothetical protein